MPFLHETHNFDKGQCNEGNGNIISQKQVQDSNVCTTLQSNIFSSLFCATCIFIYVKSNDGCLTCTRVAKTCHTLMMTKNMGLTQEEHVFKIKLDGFTKFSDMVQPTSMHNLSPNGCSLSPYYLLRECALIK